MRNLILGIVPALIPPPEDRFNAHAYNEVGDDEVGAFANAIAQRMRGGGGGFNPRAAGQRAAAMVPQFRGGAAPGAPRPELPVGSSQPNTLRSFLGLGIATWTGSDGAEKTLEVEPQSSFEGKRMIIDTTSSASAVAAIVTVNSLFVGEQPQSPSISQAAAAAGFRADCTNADLDLQIAYRASKITLKLGVTAAPGGTETRTAVAMLYGNWIR
jgi:hypothetical protein